VRTACACQKSRTTRTIASGRRCHEQDLFSILLLISDRNYVTLDRHKIVTTRILNSSSVRKNDLESKFVCRPELVDLIKH